MTVKFKEWEVRTADQRRILSNAVNAKALAAAEEAARNYLANAQKWSSENSSGK